MILALALLACGDAGPTQPPAPRGAIGFPHAADYASGGSHGVEALAEPASCGGCHRDGSSAPTCASCHADYPHPVGFLAGAVHGVGLTGVSGSAAREACLACHAVEGAAAPSCTSCHPSWPHPEGWAQVGAHGAWALVRGSAEAACGSCHGEGLAGTPTADGCRSCHADYPHVADFADPAVHRVADQAGCAGCHGEVGEGGASGVACSRCHPTFPHPADQRVAHVATAARVGEPVCLGCHEAGDAPPIPATCALVCHGRTP